MLLVNDGRVFDYGDWLNLVEFGLEGKMFYLCLEINDYKYIVYI